jgi:hypothetical protein
MSTSGESWTIAGSPTAAEAPHAVGKSADLAGTETRDRTRAIARPAAKALWERRDVPAAGKGAVATAVRVGGRAAPALTLGIENLDLSAKQGKTTAKASSSA